MTWIWWAIPLIIVTSVWTLNEFLRGRLKRIISGVFAILIFFFVAVAFVVSGWKVGIGALVGAFVLVNLLLPVASAVARRIISNPDLGLENHGRRSSEQTGAIFESVTSIKSWEREKDIEASHKTETISTAMNNPRIARVLTQLDLAEQDLVAFYDRVEIRCLPLKDRKSALENAELVEYFLKNSEPYDVYDGTYGRRVSESTQIRLQLWIQSNPGGERPR